MMLSHEFMRIADVSAMNRLLRQRDLMKNRMDRTAMLMALLTAIRVLMIPGWKDDLLLPLIRLTSHDKSNARRP